MSRTYRNNEELEWVANGRKWTRDELWQHKEDIGLSKWDRIGWTAKTKIIKNGRDKKRWDKPDKSFKSMRRRIERAKVRNAMAQDKDVPRIRKSDQYDWT